MKVVFITENSYWERDHHRFGLDLLEEKGYSVEIWRVISNASIKFETQAGMYRGENYYEISENQFSKILLNNKNELFFSNITNQKLLISLMSTGVDYILFKGMGGIMEFPNEKEEEKYSLINRFRKRMETGITQSFKNLILNISNYCDYNRYLKLLIKNPPKLIITSTHYVADRYLLPEEKNCNVMYIHSMDYDRYLEAKCSGEDECILYCDSGFFDLDQDCLIHTRTLPTAEHREECLAQLEMLFEKLESYYGVPVVIAGHPHTKYESDMFCGRKIIFNNIGNLAINAVAFVLQTSTALSFGAINDLPTVQVVNSYFKQFGLTVWDKISVYDHVKYQTETLGHGFLDMDDEEKMEHPWDFVKKMDEKKRKDYMEKYIIDSDKTDRTTIEYIEEFIRNRIR